MGQQSNEVKERERQRLRALYLADPEKFKRRAREWKQNNPERFAEGRRARESKSSRKQQRHDYYEAHRDAILLDEKKRRENDPEINRKRCRENYKRNRAARIAKVREREKRLTPEQKSAINFTRNKRRRALNKGAEGKFTWAEYRQILAAQGSCCFWCSGDVSDGSDHADHYIPLSRGGSNWPSNIVASCGPCNQAKGAKMPDEFREEVMSNNVSPKNAELGAPALSQHKPKEPPEWTRGLDEHGRKKEEERKS